MKLFMIGATGYVGSVVAERLKADGHEITGLARSADAAAAGIEPVRGAMGDRDVLGEHATKADGVVQIATGGFLVQALETVNEAVGTVKTLLAALAATDKPYVLTGGTGAYLDTGIAFPERVVTEADPISPPHFYSPLGDILRKVAATENVRTIVPALGQVCTAVPAAISALSHDFSTASANTEWSTRWLPVPTRSPLCMSMTWRTCMRWRFAELTRAARSSPPPTLSLRSMSPGQ